MILTGWQHRRRLLQIVAVLLAGLLFGCREPVPERATNTVTVLGGLAREQEDKLKIALRPFEEQTGIEVQYESSLNFISLLAERVGAGRSPDIAIFPQPALIARYAEAGHLVPLTAFLEEERLRQTYSDDWLAFGSFEGDAYGLWYLGILKQLVWYRPSVFEENDYSVPKTWDEMIRLSDRIVAAGETPWCIGLDSGEATGWVGTDWIEGILMRTAGPDVYRQWAAGELPFSSPPVIRAFDIFGDILREPNYVQEGTLETVITPVNTSPLGLFDSPPSCYLHQQGSFISLFFPEDELARQDYDFFLLPEIEPQFGTPIIVSGDAFAMFNNTPAAQQLMTYMASAEPHEIWAKQGGFISPNRQVPLDTYPNSIDRKAARILLEADDIYFDASDTMPDSVGLRPFWRGVVNFAIGRSAEEVTQSIDSERP